ncbi:hypothetical protein [Clostridium sp. 'White wine YQ']|uniref:hypothetical protein n=1 Tax=Clostridium sp. 'White wine YQ' TaxID=3027474 RepID=UPI0023670C62|nr:hypothetical protein [Clostridium sp. 'White wine YQ']MDD7793344.1 hypothetical protein [Clostridium sp. 'White wine YQ']
MENKIKHLELIQGIISRMANNSFLLKGWAITLVAAMFALAAKDSNNKYIILTYFPVLMFWILDSYFLSQENYFRKYYEEVRNKNEDDIDFSMKSETLKWSIIEWAKECVSLTIGIFYGTIIILLIVVMYFI